MPRYALLIEYHGGPFAGWQRQPALLTVQGRIEAALARIAPESPVVFGAGRTDAGVHATGQVAHIDLARDWEPFRLCEALNFHLKPDPVAILGAARVADDFHARFSARERRYEFRILNRRAPPAREAGLVWHLRHPLDVAAMREGARHLIGRHDFTTFRSSICQADSPVRTMDEITIDAAPCPGGQELRLRFRARSFLHNQVRSLVGSLERVGSGAWEPARIASALSARDRAACGPVSPPDGLMLTGVGYPCGLFDAAPPANDGH